MRKYVTSQMRRLRRRMYSKYMHLAVRYAWVKPIYGVTIDNPYAQLNDKIDGSTISFAVYKFDNLNWTNPTEGLMKYPLPMASVIKVDLPKGKFEMAICVNDVLEYGDSDMCEAAIIHEAGHVLIDTYFPKIGSNTIDGNRAEIAADTIVWREGRGYHLSRLIAKIVSFINDDPSLKTICTLLKVRCLLALAHANPVSSWDDTDIALVNMYDDMFEELNVIFKE